MYSINKNDVIQEVIPILTKQKVQVMFDFNGGKLTKELDEVIKKYENKT